MSVLPFPEHGTRRRYDAGCQCVPCREGNTRRNRRQKDARFARRVRVFRDGRWRMIAEHLSPEQHGKPGTRTNHGCECVPCARAQSDRCKTYGPSRTG